MHQKPKIPKLRLYKYLHSIPRYLQHSIPIVSALLFLLLSTLCINPILKIDIYAVESSGENDVGKSNLTESKEKLDKTESDSETEVRDTLTEENDSESSDDLDEAKREDLALSESEEAVDNPIMPLSAENPTPVATLSVDGSLGQITPASAGDISYRSQNVTINMQDISNYVLQISYASDVGDALKFDGPTTTNSTIGNAGNKTPANMDGNTWGYAWSDNIGTAESDLAYQTMPNYGNGTTLKTESVSNGAVLTKSVTGRLTFAAKFSGQAPAGHYKTKVLLSLTAAPKTVLTSISTMQGMTTQLCNDAKPFETAQLRDTRDDSYYDITKLEDGRCWMTQNLRLVGSKTLTSNDSDVSSDYAMPANVGSWNSVTKDANGKSGDFALFVHYAGNTTNGAYYSWCLATASSGSYCSERTASGSICPKGWTLPTRAEYDNLLSKAEIGDDSAGVTKIMGSPYNFPAAGRVYDYIQSIGSEGRYWTSTPGNNAAFIGYLRFTSSNVATGGGYTSSGYSVRCVAR